MLKKKAEVHKMVCSRMEQKWKAEAEKEDETLRRGEP